MNSMTSELFIFEWLESL